MIQELNGTISEEGILIGNICGITEDDVQRMIDEQIYEALGDDY